ncbi:hypothetical protein PR003_g29202 [Phytophthora rubi]|uniref:Uncharacterized protein n=1 Tax=Phytophthora rubi TaxID=129364 RepID=A0A6A4BQ15_9STRA|nr:hypothetical protein PR001_g28039 [Phytophthora rubi]KAE8968045.1 hypothetical protein PR002_g27878 [Phytophthora rubi]KAE9275924.1 hypothetical protein PR003_g29202 [Phytophthora rubi]
MIPYRLWKIGFLLLISRNPTGIGYLKAQDCKITKEEKVFIPISSQDILWCTTLFKIDKCVTLFASDPQYIYNSTQNSFTFEVMRKLDRNPLFDSSGKPTISIRWRTATFVHGKKAQYKVEDPQLQ